jgi:cysteine desulfurase
VKTVYLDNSTVARPSPEAVSKMLSFFSDKWGSLTQPHQKGQELFSDLQQAWQAVYDLLGASRRSTIVLTSSGAEAMNHAILSTYQDVALTQGKNHFITALTDEAPAIMSLNRLEAFGCAATFIKPNAQGLITREMLSEVITPRTALIALSWANGLTGVVQPILEIAELCQMRGIRLAVEATHVLGKLFFDLRDLSIDFVAFNGEQLHAPKSIGGLYIKEGLRLSPFIVGGIEQEGLRAGSINVPATVALGTSAKQCLDARDFLCTEVARLKMHFEKEVVKRIPQAKVLFEAEERVPHITTIAFPGVINEALLFLLNRRGVYASLGGGSQQQISYILNACGANPDIASSGLSFSLSRETTEEDVERAAFALEECYSRLLKASPC